MIAFLTSFRARALARDWAYHVWLLEQTVRSMLAQTRGEVRVLIGCHDLPEAGFRGDPRVECVQVRCQPPARDNDDMCVDKTIKLSAAAERAVAFGCEYVIFNDADDLVSNRLVGFVTDNRGPPGWYCGEEMFYTYGGRVMRRFEISGRSAGPCLIVRTDLLSFASPPFSGPWTELLRRGGEARYLELLARHGLPVVTLAAAGLGHYRELMANLGKPLARLPFPGNVVINHADSTATVSGGVGSYWQEHSQSVRRTLARFRTTLGMLRTLRPMNRSIRAEFSIPDDATIPAAYKSGGSVLWR